MFIVVKRLGGSMALGTEVGLCPGDFVLDRDPMAGCITMPLGVEIGLSPGDFVFDGD